MLVKNCLKLYMAWLCHVTNTICFRQESFQHGVRREASFFFGARIWLGTILGRFSIIYFSGLGLRIRVRVRVRVWVRVKVKVRVRVWVRVRTMDCILRNDGCGIFLVQGFW